MTRLDQAAQIRESISYHRSIKWRAFWSGVLLWALAIVLPALIVLTAVMAGRVR